MGRLFGLDSPPMRIMGKFADLICLNFLAVICCIPIITIGASMTALHYVTLKMVRDEETYITRSFFKSFKENFKQATIAWLIILAVMVILGVDFAWCYYSGADVPSWFKVALIVITAILLFAFMHVFPLLARFENTLKELFKNSLFMAMLSVIRTVFMMVCWLIPVVITFAAPQIFPVVFCLGLSGPVFLNALLYDKTFKRFEPEEEKNEHPDDWHVEVEEEEETIDPVTDNVGR